MTTRVKLKANEQSTFVIRYTFRDEDKQPVAPSSINWTLLRLDGSVVNGREDVPLTPATTVPVVLSGEDLKLWPVDDGLRRLFFSGTYDSTLGENLPFTDEIEFEIENLVGVPAAA